MTARKAAIDLQRHKHNENLEKRCTGPCREWKPLRDFYRSRAAKDGRQSRCKVCDDARSTARGFSAESKPGAEKAGKYCRECAGLAHRVEGIRCPRCKLRYAPEAPVELELHLRRFDDIRALA